MTDGFSSITVVPSTATAKDNTDVVVDNTVGGVVLLPKNVHRRSALIVNTGAGAMRVTTDGSAPTSTHGKPVVVGGALALSGPDCPTEAVKAIRQDATDTTANASEVF